jgi:hypothetical protein
MVLEAKQIEASQAFRHFTESSPGPQPSILNPWISPLGVCTVTKLYALVIAPLAKRNRTFRPASRSIVILVCGSFSRSTAQRACHFSGDATVSVAPESTMKLLSGTIVSAVAKISSIEISSCLLLAPFVLAALGPEK